MWPVMATMRHKRLSASALAASHCGGAVAIGEEHHLAEQQT